MTGNQGESRLLERIAAVEGAAGLFSVLLPGESQAMATLRERATQLARDATAHGALIIGPAGSGKSTLARAVALGRALHLRSASSRADLLASIRLDGPARLATGPLDWYREQSLTGLSGAQADAQLFGIIEGAATDVGARLGVFRSAMAGSDDPDDPTLGARLTGGVVLLDEIGDMEEALQPKLLVALAGGEIYPLGAEGNRDHVYTFRGLALAATWRPLSSLRPDLAGRLSDYVLAVPSLRERREDMDHLISTIVAEVARSRRAEATRLQRIDDVSRDLVEELRSTPSLSTSECDSLKEQDWSRLGELRGLTQVIRRVICSGCAVDTAIEEQLAPAQDTISQPAAGEALLDALLATKPEGRRLSALVKSLERRERDALADLVGHDHVAAERLARHLGIDRSTLRKALADLRRTRTSPRRQSPAR